MPKESGKTPFKTEKRHVHLLVDPDVYRMAKIECAKVDMDLSHATEQLWRQWSKGNVHVKKEV